MIAWKKALTLLFASQLFSVGATEAHGADEEVSMHEHVARKTLIEGTYRGGEVTSKQMYFEPGQRLKVRWRAKPAKGNCVVTLFSLFNADLLFSSRPDSEKPRWSELAIETFGGSDGSSSKQFQTQYISQNDPNASPTTRGLSHVQEHFTRESNIPDIFDGRYHNFEIDFRPYESGRDARIIYRMDGRRIREVNGGDANNLESPLDIYAGVWAGRPEDGWACTSNDDRPSSATAFINNIRIWERNGSSWSLRKRYEFKSSSEITDNWNLSDWSFGSFDGAFDSSAVVSRSDRMRLRLIEN